MNRLFTILLLLLCSIQAFAQVETPKISGIYMGMSFPRFANSIEEETSYRFIYREADVDSLTVNLQAQNVELRTLLNQVFSGSGLFFTIDSQKQVWITKGKPITLDFPSTYFNVLSDPSQVKAEEGIGAFAKNQRFSIGRTSDKPESKQATISGIVSSVESGKPMSGAVVVEKTNYTQVTTDREGRFQITLDKGRHTIYVQNIGGYQEQRHIDLRGDGILNIEIQENILSLDEVVVSSGALSHVNKLEMGVQSLSVAEVKRLPAVMGEVDVLRGILTMPGVNTAGEATVGFNVRGGSADQNLILYGQSTVFNPSHVFGFFSAFNSDMVSGVELHKGSVPVNYGGRLSSVLEIEPKFGRAEKIGGSGGIGILTSRLSLDGPIGKNTTFLIGGRTTYSNWALDLLEENAELSGSDVAFYDWNANIQHRINDKNSLELISYMSRDKFSFDPDTTYSYQNLNLALSWRRYFNERLEGKITLGRDAYEFNIEGLDNPLNSFNYGFDIEQLQLRTDFEYRNGKHIFDFGFQAIQYTLNPGHMSPFGPESIVTDKKLDEEKGREFSVFVGDEIQVNDKLAFSLGMRYMLYQLLGPAQFKEYSEGGPYTPGNVTGEVNFGEGEVVQTYHGPEFRLGGRYILDNKSSLKFGVNTMRQNIHLLSNSSVITPTDSWKLSDLYLKPQLGQQASLGYFRNIFKNSVEFSAEVFYRTMSNLLDYRSGASIILNEDLEQDALNTDGKAYGLEFLLKKSAGQFKGSLAYTYSRSLLKTSDEPSVEKINKGDYYPSNFDQPHNLVLVTNYELSKRINTSLNVNYSTGRPITLPAAEFDYGGSERVYYTDRNAYRIPDYFRIDFSINLEGSHKIKKLAHSSWSLGVYNLLGRSNPYSVFFIPENGQLRGYQLSIFARPIPFITYNFRF
ncbi:TonB-dependent receptor [Algoriphagus sp. A40]|uniref:TonB-dependent receptor n=1 Tax=Algoriphagus sp. A40 TaxID=1945863 RepID=UPI000985EF17|nr:TonB-dependent receptor [Algoriphagus sp. A40]OOG72306.1 TonB-dependent receptor [Algoriphagus sp. A40]